MGLQDKSRPRTEPVSLPSAQTQPVAVLTGMVINVPELLGKSRTDVEAVVGQPDIPHDPLAQNKPRDQHTETVPYSVQFQHVEITYNDDKAEKFTIELSNPAGSAADAIRAFNIDATQLTGSENGDTATYSGRLPNIDGNITVTAHRAEVDKWTRVEASGWVKR